MNLLPSKCSKSAPPPTEKSSGTAPFSPTQGGKNGWHVTVALKTNIPNTVKVDGLEEVLIPLMPD